MLLPKRLLYTLGAMALYQLSKHSQEEFKVYRADACFHVAAHCRCRFPASEICVVKSPVFDDFTSTVFRVCRPLAVATIDTVALFKATSTRSATRNAFFLTMKYRIR
jgi:hypothetical protein